MRLLSTLLLGTLLCGGASAQDPALEYKPLVAPIQTTLGGCLDQGYNRDSDLACQDLTIRACLAMGPQGDTTMGHVGCSGILRDLWEAELAEAWSAMQQAPEDAEGQRAEQAAWEAYREAACAFEVARHSGGSIAWHAGDECCVELTAERLVHFREVLRVR